MITRSKRKAFIFCEANSNNDDIHVQLRVELPDGKKTTYYCTPFQALNHMLSCKFIWFSPSVINEDTNIPAIAGTGIR